MTFHPRDPNPDLEILVESRDLGGLEFTSHRALLGPAVLSVKRALRLFLRPVLNRQTGFNEATHRLVSDLVEQVARMSHEVAALHAEVEGLRLDRDELAALRAEVQLLQRENHAALDLLEGRVTDALGRIEALLSVRDEAGNP